MKRSICILITCCLVSFLFAQKITPTVMSCAGDVMKSGNFSIEWTLGEIATETLRGTSNIITQGFHQTNLTIVSTYNPFISGLEVYPNPVEQELIINNQSGKQIMTHVFNLNGQCVGERNFNPGTESFNMNAFPAGVYILEAITDNQKQNFTIEKIK